VIDDSSSTLQRSDLQARNITLTASISGTDVRAFQANAPLPSGKSGWYIDLDKPKAGERVTNRPQLRGNVLVTASLVPPTNNSCEAGGSGYINALDAFTGTSLTEPYFDVNGDGVYNQADKVSGGTLPPGTPVPVGSIDLGVGMPTLPTVIDGLLLVGGSTGSLGKIPVNPQGGVPRRVSWREIVRN